MEQSKKRKVDALKVAAAKQSDQGHREQAARDLTKANELIRSAVVKPKR